MKFARIVTLLLAVIGVAAAQTKGFTCPDANAAASCKSYRELVEHHDADLGRNILANRDPLFPVMDVVCFRPKVDSFFMLEFHLRRTPVSWSIVDPEGADGYVQTFENGVAVTESVPFPVFSGHWSKDGKQFEGRFDKGKGQTLISPDAIHVDFRDGDWWYELGVQRSTGRFIESGNDLPERHGRCIEVH